MIPENVQVSRNKSAQMPLIKWWKLQQELKKRFGKIQDKFTQRELEIIALLAQGHNNAYIGDLLFISKHTVDTHRKNIYKKGDFKGLRDIVLFSLIMQTETEIAIFATDK